MLAIQRTNIVFYANYLWTLPANVAYNLAIVFLLLRELVNVLNSNYSSHIENNLHYLVSKSIFSVDILCMKIYALTNSRNIRLNCM